MTPWRRLAEMIESHGAAALVRVHAVHGSAPREPGAVMLVRADGAFSGTIGGGRLEWEALNAAKAALAAGRGPARFLDRALGPELGQCCGGRVVLGLETFDARDLADLAALEQAREDGRALVCRVAPAGRVSREPGALVPPPLGRGRGLDVWLEEPGPPPTRLLLFGAGHVGRALVLALAPLPFRVRWVDPRIEAFPRHVPSNVTPIRSPDPPAEIAGVGAGAFVLVMTHEHPLDLAVTAAALEREDLAFVGLIGSATKRARFVRRFRDGGLAPERIARLVCPIGLPGIAGKEPATIAAATAAQLLQERERVLRAGLSIPCGPAALPTRRRA